MQNLNLVNVKIQAGFSFRDTEAGITITGSCSLDNASRKIKELSGTVYADGNDEGSVLIGTVAVHTNQDDNTFNTVAPYDMDDSVRMSAVCRDMFAAIKNHDFTPVAAEETGNSEETDNAEEGAES